MASAYGDSFTHGDEVQNDQTWPAELSHILGGRVVNFGVSGYGTGQALLKLQRHLELGIVAPVTILCISDGNLNRIPTGFRPFLNNDSGIKLGFKPAFHPVDGEVAYLPNPWKDRDLSLSGLKSLATELAKTDFWANRWLSLTPEFPFTLQTLRLLDRVTVKIRDAVVSNNSNDLWTVQEGLLIMDHIVSTFLSATSQHGTQPAVILLPHTENRQNERIPPSYGPFRDRIRAQYGDRLIVVDMYEHPFDEALFQVVPYRGHTSHYGNRRIAEVLSTEIWSRQGGVVRPRPDVR